MQWSDLVLSPSYSKNTDLQKKMMEMGNTIKRSQGRLGESELKQIKEDMDTRGTGIHI